MRTIQMTLDDDLVEKVDTIANELIQPAPHLLELRCEKRSNNTIFGWLPKV